jgi:hypothetical protein
LRARSTPVKLYSNGTIPTMDDETLEFHHHLCEVCDAILAFNGTYCECVVERFTCSDCEEEVSLNPHRRGQVYMGCMVEEGN